MGELEDRLDPGRTRQDGPWTLAPIAEARGLVYRGTASERPTTFRVSPRATADSLAGGLFRGAWPVTGEGTRLVDEARERLVALPDPDVPRVRETSDFVMVFEKP